MYIVAIMITAVVFSVTGLGVMNLATLVNLDTQNAIEKLQNKMETESLTNVALWRINSSADSLGNFSLGNVTSSYDSTNLVLTVEIKTQTDTSGFVLSLEEDFHFRRAIATETYIDDNYGTTHANEAAEHDLRDSIGFLPEVDMAYFIANAANVSYMEYEHIHDDDVVEGINIFYGDYLEIHNVDIENATLVFTGYNIKLKDDVRIVAPIVGGVAQPAMIIMDPSNDTHFDQGYGDVIHIEGAIYSKGYVRLHEGEFTGPIVAHHARICRDIDMIDDTNSLYYEWNLGFGELTDYDFRKHIIEWETL
ncbi:hypothetical protein HQ531_07890 [bacterium]|nr:hypothetical protein [bacterium]